MDVENNDSNIYSHICFHVNVFIHPHTCMYEVRMCFVVTISSTFMLYYCELFFILLRIYVSIVTLRVILNFRIIGEYFDDRE